MSNIPASQSDRKTLIGVAVVVIAIGGAFFVSSQIDSSRRTREKDAKHQAEDSRYLGESPEHRLTRLQLRAMEDK